MNVLLIGSGGREHALAWKISSSPLLKKLYCAPGNPGTAFLAENRDLDSHMPMAVIEFCQQNAIHLVVIGPEQPLVAGLADDLRRANIAVVGPSADAARLEGSKIFTKNLCAEFAIPTAAYKIFDDAHSAKEYLYSHNIPVVIKADGLAGGKGVVVALSLEEALAAIDSCFAVSIEDSCKKIIIEEFLTGQEASFFCLCDGSHVIPFATAEDHKRVGEGDTGPNTGGMGAYSPSPIMTEAMTERVLQEIIYPTMQAMIEIGSPFSGILFCGLMITTEGPKLIEYNVRFGDPECQAMMMRLDDDVLPWLWALATGTLAEKQQTSSLRWSDSVAVNVVLAAKNYPQSPETGSVISGLDQIDPALGCVIFHAGTTIDNHQLQVSGGRILSVTALGKTVQEARHKAYAAFEKIECPGSFFRTDIGWRALQTD